MRYRTNRTTAGTTNLLVPQQPDHCNAVWFQRRLLKKTPAPLAGHTRIHHIVVCHHRRKTNQFGLPIPWVGKGHVAAGRTGAGAEGAGAGITGFAATGAAGFFATAFLAAGFLAAAFLAAGFLATAFLAAGFLASALLADGLFG